MGDKNPKNTKKANSQKEADKNKKKAAADAKQAAKK